MSPQPRTSDIASLAVRRPVLATVLSLLIVVAGMAAYFGVQVRELPDVDRPVISISASYEGAAPETVDSQVTSVLEGAAARVPGVADISSTSRYGRSRVVVEFSESADMNVAAGDIRDAVGNIRRRLPDDVDDPVIVKADSDARPIIQLAVTSPTLAIEEVTAIVENRIVDRLSAVEGVADVQVFGAQQQIVAVDIDAAALAARGLTIEDLRTALADIAQDAPSGSFDDGGQTLIVRAEAGVSTAEEIAATWLTGHTRLADVADIRLAPAERQSALRSNGETGVGIGVIRQAQSNTLDISRDIGRAVEQLNQEISDDISIDVASDEAVFIDSAVREVVKTLGVATLIVVSVIFIFLRSWRATLIPTVTVPVAVIGTLAGIWLAGFSVNILTLLALVLATGMVVDDAIVVLENIERRRRQGLGPRAAAVLGTRQVFFAVVATTAVLASVFIPISFFPGAAGRLFFEFGFVLAISVLLSSIVALTLAPMMASRMLAPEPADRTQGALSRLLGGIGDMAARVYARTLEWSLKAPVIVLALALLFGAGAISTYHALPEQLVPQEDRGTIMMMVRAPQGTSLDYTAGKVAEVEAIAQRLVDRDEAEAVFAVTGRRGGNTAFVTVPLVPWTERERGQAEISAELDEALAEIVGVRVSTRTGNSLNIRGGGEGLRFAVTGSSYDAIADTAEEMVHALEDRVPGLTNPMLGFDLTQPQISLNIDRTRAADLGISVDAISLALQTMLDGRQAGEIFVGDEAIPIRMRAPEDSIVDSRDIANLHVRANGGGLIPLAAIVDIEEMAVSPSLSREGQLRAVSIRAGLADGYDMRTAMSDVQAVAADTLPPGMGIRFLSEAATLDETARGLLLTFVFAFVIVLLVLAAQFESFLSAAIIVATVPFALAAAVFAMALTGGSLNIYSQIGLVMLIGLMAKNGILIVEFANQLRDRGRDVPAAIREACAIRFRPVMMTLTSTVLGGLPLIVGFGAGAEAREALGWIVVGGLGFATLFTLYLTPVLFQLLAPLSRPRASEAARLEDEMANAEQHEEALAR